MLVGVTTLNKFQNSIEDLEPVGLACSSNILFEKSGYHPYEAGLGGKFVCIVTQFLHELTQANPIGLITWSTCILAAIPAFTLISIEAGRYGAKGLLRFPTVFSLLGQYIGISVIFSAIWVPCFLYGGTTTGNVGAVTPIRAYASGLMILPFLIGTILVFGLDTSTYAWTLSAGVLAGPLAALPPILLWPLLPPQNEKPDDVAKGCFAVANVHILSTIVGFVGWSLVVFKAIDRFGTDTTLLWNDIWVDPLPSVYFMTWDAMGLFAGVIIYICSINLLDGMIALLLTPFLGPGAACSLMLARLEVHRGNEAMTRIAKKSN
jgi:hypothetical protein